MAFELERRAFGPRSDITALSLNDVAVALGDQGKLAPAESLHREALAIVRANNPQPDERVAGLLDDLASVLDFEGKSAAADSAYRETLALRKQLLGADHPDYAMTLFNYSGFVFDQKRYEEAADMAREILALRGKIAGRESSIGRGRAADARQAASTSSAIRLVASERWWKASRYGESTSTRAAGWWRVRKEYSANTTSPPENM